jgi:hypothetical protein
VRADRNGPGLGSAVVFGGIHATLFPEEAHQYGAAHRVVRGGDVAWVNRLTQPTRGAREVGCFGNERSLAVVEA